MPTENVHNDKQSVSQFWQTIRYELFLGVGEVWWGREVLHNFPKINIFHVN